MKTKHRKTTTVYYCGLKVLLLLFVVTGSRSAFAQCPANIDFESGNFSGWLCYYQDGYTGGIPNPVNLTFPIAGRHDMLSNPPGNGFDFYGNFPKNCPNGSGHSIKLGVETIGQHSDKVSYTFTIPAGQNIFSLIYNYAIVLNDGGANHNSSNQPNFRIEAKNITDGTPLPCPMNPIIVGGQLPGFKLSPFPHNGAVYYKEWSAASINLDNLAGKTIELSFTACGCGLNGGTHFGYAYIDVSSECSSSFVGATYCPDDAFINVTAPFGYDVYTWYSDPGLTIPIGNTQTINFTPPPPAGTLIYVKMEPFPGYGCINVLTAELLDTLTIQSQAGPDQLSCNNAPVQLGVIPKLGYVYSWSPVTGLSNPNISNPVATPSITTQYVVTTSHEGGGCISTDTVIISAAVINNSLQVTGPTSGCITGTQPTILTVFPQDSIQWYRNGVAIPGANQTQYNVVQSGDYYATLFSFTGCNMSTPVQNIAVYPAPVVGFNVNSPDQCFKNNQYNFTNTSSVSSGTLTYDWNLGDGTTVTTQDVNYSYTQPGTYIVKLVVTTDNGCKDSSFFTVHVYASAVAGFTVNPPELCFKNNQFIFTNSSAVPSGTLQYRWDMGDASTIITTRDVIYSYAQPGSYTVKLLITTDNGCKDSTSFNVSGNPEPVAAFAVNNTPQCFTNNQFIFTNGSSVSSGTLQYLWDLGDGSTATTTDITHNYTQPGDYIVKMTATSDKGCADVSSFAVKVHPFATADFSVDPVCINITLPLNNKTANNTATALNYLWDFGNGQSSTLRNPVYSYPAPGTYSVSLSVNTNQCPVPLTTKKIDVVIDAPAKGIIYPEKDAVMNFPEPLQARLIGNTVLWSPGINLDNRVSYKPFFNGMYPQLYTIQLKTLTGCITVDTQMVKTHKKIEIYVPTIFTPGSSNGLNDYLRPLLMGFSKVNYFRIYNRWGKMLFQMQSDRPGWDGKVNGVAQEMQTVVWMIEAIDVDGKMYQRQGTTVLMR